ncbi:CST complex subunit CTC1 [Plasmodiophora brassicae]
MTGDGARGRRLQEAIESRAAGCSCRQCIDRLGIALGSSAVASIRDLQRRATPFRSAGDTVLIARLGHDRTTCSPVLADHSGEIPCALSSSTMARPPLHNEWIIVRCWALIMQGETYAGLEIDSGSIVRLPCHHDSCEAAPSPVAFADCLRRYEQRRQKAFTAISFAVAAVSLVFRHAPMFFVEATCAVDSLTPVAAYIAFTGEHLTWRPFVRMSARYTLTDVAIKSMRTGDSPDRNRVVFLAKPTTLLCRQMAMVPRYRGLVTGHVMDGVYEIDEGKVVVYLTHATPPCLRSGIGIRVGALVDIFNAHVIPSDDASRAVVGLCTYGSIEIVKLSATMKAEPRFRVSPELDRLDLVDAVAVSRALISLKERFRQRVRSARLLAACLDLVLGQSAREDFRRNEVDEFFEHWKCNLVAPLSVARCRRHRVVSALDDLRPGSSILAGRLTVDPTCGALIVSEDGRSRRAIQCHVPDLVVKAMNVPLCSVDFQVAESELAGRYVTFRLSSSLMFNRPRQERPANRSTFRGRVLTRTESVGDHSFSILAQIVQSSAVDPVCVRCQGLAAAAVETVVRPGRVYDFIDVIASESGFVVDNDGDVVEVDGSDRDICDVSTIVGRPFEKGAIVSVRAHVSQMELREHDSTERTATIVLGLVDYRSAETVEAYVEISLKRPPVQLKPGAIVTLMRIERHLSVIGNVYLHGTPETAMFIEAEFDGSDGLETAPQLPTVTLRMLRDPFAPATTQRTICFVTSITRIRMRFSGDSSIDLRVSAVVDDGTSQANVSLDGDNARLVLPPLSGQLYAQLRSAGDVDLVPNRPSESMPAPVHDLARTVLRWVSQTTRQFVFYGRVPQRWPNEAPIADTPHSSEITIGKNKFITSVLPRMNLIVSKVEETDYINEAYRLLGTLA